jgi:hypothetical protein
MRLMAVGILLLGGLVHVAGCQSTAKRTAPETANTQASNRWLEEQVAFEDLSTRHNPETGLMEVDTMVVLNELEPGRPTGYRLVARTQFYHGNRDKPVDTSAWSELLLETQQPVAYASTSLVPADDFVIEIAYPEEVGLR